MEVETEPQSAHVPQEEGPMRSNFKSSPIVVLVIGMAGSG